MTTCNQNPKVQEAASRFMVTDIFVVNGAMASADPGHQAAWERCRAKLIVAARIPTPRLHIPHELLDEHGRIIPGKVATRKR